MLAKFVDIGGVETRILYSGDPQNYPILFIHGGGIAADSWVRNIDALSEKFFVVAPDMVGHGFTRPVDFAGDAPHPKTVAHLVDIVRHYGWQKLCVSGSSYGALIGTLMYFAIPDLIDEIIVNSSGSMFNTPEEHQVALQGTLKNSMSAFDNPTTETCRRRLQNILYEGRTVPDEVVHTQVTQYALPWARQAWLDTLTAMMNPTSSDKHRVLHRLAEIKARMLVVWGKQDKRGHLESALKAIKSIPNVEIEIMDRCGHMPYMEDPENYNRIVTAFLKNRITP